MCVTYDGLADAIVMRMLQLQNGSTTRTKRKWRQTKKCKKPLKYIRPVTANHYLLLILKIMGVTWVNIKNHIKWILKWSFLLWARTPAAQRLAKVGKLHVYRNVLLHALLYCQRQWCKFSIKFFNKFERFLSLEGECFYSPVWNCWMYSELTWVSLYVKFCP